MVVKLENKGWGKGRREKRKSLKRGKREFLFTSPFRRKFCKSNDLNQMDILLVCRLRSKVSKALERLTLNGWFCTTLPSFPLNCRCELRPIKKEWFNDSFYRLVVPFWEIINLNLTFAVNVTLSLSIVMNLLLWTEGVHIGKQLSTSYPELKETPRDEAVSNCGKSYGWPQPIYCIHSTLPG